MRSAEQIKQDTMQLWREVFGDAEDFIKLYFSDKYRHEHNLWHEEGGRVVAALQTLPYDYNVQQEVWQTGYLSGVATLPLWRGKGLAAKLIGQAHDRLHSQGTALAWLIPASASLRHYYARLGYAVCAWQPQPRRSEDIRHAATEARFQDIRLDNKPSPDAAALILSCLSSRLYAIRHNEDTLRTVLADFAMAHNIRWFSIRHRGSLHTLAILRQEPTKAYSLLDAFTPLPDDTLAALLRQALPQADIFDKRPLSAPSADAQPYAMWRILDIPQVLAHYARLHPQAVLTLTIHDEEIANNSGEYHIKHGLCHHRQPQNEKLQGISAAQFGRWCAQWLIMRPTLMMD